MNIMQSRGWTNVNQKMRQVNLKDPQTHIKENPIIIDSRDRDRELYPDTNNYVVKFDNNEDGNISRNYRNIHSIELVQAILPQAVLNATTGVPYINLEIEEIRDSFQGTNTALRNSFAFLSPQDVYGSNYLSCKFYRSAKRVFDPPLGSLNKFTIELRHPDGTLYDFGSDNPAGSAVDETVQTMFYFVINTLEAKHDTISIQR